MDVEDFHRYFNRQLKVIVIVLETWFFHEYISMFDLDEKRTRFITIAHLVINLAFDFLERLNN